MSDSALAGVRVVELGDGVSLGHGARQLAILGAEVLALRTLGSDAIDAPFARYLDEGKRVQALQLTDPAARERVETACAGADLLVEDLGPGVLEAAGLSPSRLRQATPSLAVVRVAARGQQGDGRAWTTLTRQAAAGWVNRHDSRSADGPPFQAGGSYSDMAVGAFVAAAGLTALRAVAVRGIGEDIDLSATACLHSMLQRTRMRMDYVREIGLETKGIGHQALAVHLCRDGWIGINVLTGQQWSDACAMVGLPEYADKQAALGQDPALRAGFERSVDAWCAQQVQADVVELGQALRIPVSPLSDAETVRDVRQWLERPFFVPVPGNGRHTEPGPPWRPSGMALRSGGAVAGDAERVRPRPNPDGRALPLAGVRVVDLGTFYAAPCATQYLGALGAEIIKIEGVRRPDGFRFIGTSPALGADWAEKSMLFQATNLNKRSVAVDLTTERGRDLVLGLVGVADVVIENFSARVMDNFNLGHEVLRAHNDRIVTVRMPGYGLTGPWRDFVGFGPGFEQTAGLAYVTGFSDDRPATPGGYLDPVVGMTAVTAVLAALVHRDRTGEGQLIEVVQAEVAAGMAAEQIVHQATTGEVRERIGNRGHHLAPQGVYPCRGDAGWLALSVGDDAQWSALVTLLGEPPWARDGALRTLAGRQAAHDEIDAELTAWTAPQSGAALVERLTGHGIAAAEVLAPSMYLEDEHLRAWGYYAPMEHPVTGVRPYPGLPMRASYLPHHRSRSPLLGEHTREVIGGILGITDAELDAMHAEGVVIAPPAR